MTENDQLLAMLALLNFSQKRSEVYPVECIIYFTGADLTGEL